MIYQVWVDGEVCAEFLDYNSAEEFAIWVNCSVLDTCVAITAFQS